MVFEKQVINYLEDDVPLETTPLINLSKTLNYVHLLTMVILNPWIPIENI